MPAKLTYLAVVGMALMLACGREDHRREINPQPVQVAFYRLDTALYPYAYDTNFVVRYHRLLRQHRRAMEDLIIMHRLGKPTDTDRIRPLRYQRLFLQDPYMQELYDSVQRVWTPELLKEKQKAFQEAIARLKAIRPDIPDYQVYAYVAPFIYKVFVDSNVVGWELDMYLGPNFKYYPSLGLPQYMVRKFRHEYLVRDALMPLLEDLYPPPDPMPHLLANMIYNGKILYLLEHLLPDVHDTILIGWSAEKWRWVKEHEAQLWMYFIKHDLLYETEYIKYRKYVQDGARTAGLPPEAPGNVGSWIGWQIVRRYMARHPEVTIQQLMNHPDSTGQEILRASGYRPRSGWLDWD